MKDLLGLIILVLLPFSFCRSDLIMNYNFRNENFSTTTVDISLRAGETSTTKLKFDDFPSDCSQRQKLKPLYKHKNSRIKKCCPIGESLTMKDTHSGSMCGSADIQFKPNTINISLYDNCIEDMETKFTLPFEIGNPCNTSILYNEIDDIFFIAQDGSLLVMDLYANDTYALYNNYCVDINNISGTTYAIVCITSVEEHINRSQIVVIGILMLISIPCLIMVAYLHLYIKELRSSHGMILSFMSANLAIANSLYSLVHIYKWNEQNAAYAVQFFVLSYYFWFFSLCCNATVNIWFNILLGKERSKDISSFLFIIFCIIPFVGAIILVVLTYKKGLPGMPSYFIQGYTESIRESQRYFIPPVSILITLSFIAIMAAFFGFRKLKVYGVTLDSIDDSIRNRLHDEYIFGQIKNDTKCISLLGVIILSAWLLEMVTFYLPGPQIYLLLMDMINGLQGVFVLFIFLVLRRRRTIIFRWWNDRGSYSFEKAELNLIP